MQINCLKKSFSVLKSFEVEHHAQSAAIHIHLPCCICITVLFVFKKASKVHQSWEVGQETAHWCCGSGCGRVSGACAVGNQLGLFLLRHFVFFSLSAMVHPLCLSRFEEGRMEGQKDGVTVKRR